MASKSAYVKSSLGSDPVKWLFLKRYGFKKGGSLRLECTFGGQKVGFKDFEPCYGCWCWVLSFLLFGHWPGFVFTAAAPP